jgi:hypothetical protein
MFSRNVMRTVFAAAASFLTGFGGDAVPEFKFGPDHRTGAGRRTMYSYWKEKASGWHSHPIAGGGLFERARRVRQIAAGSLRVENGLAA